MNQILIEHELEKVFLEGVSSILVRKNFFLFFVRSRNGRIRKTINLLEIYHFIIFFLQLYVKEMRNYFFL
jgi:hypothetical protein